MTAHNRKTGAIDVDLIINKGKNYARSHNSGIVDASFIYNQGRFANQGYAKQVFKLTAAHEFGHSVLLYSGGIKLSWSHKGSTAILSQAVKRSTPGYPVQGEIDLMKYYDDRKNDDQSIDIFTRTTSNEIDVKRLIWMSNITFSE